MTRLAKRWTQRAGITALLFGLIALSVQAQKADLPVTTDQTTQIDAQPQTANPNVPTPGLPVDTTFHPALKAVPWLGSESPLRWSYFSIGEFTVVQVRDNFAPLTGPPEKIDLSIFRSSLIFDMPFRKQHLLLQYNPQLAVLNGKFAGNAGMNNFLTFGYTFGLTQRLSVTIKDALNQVSSRDLYPENELAIDRQAGGLVQNDFLTNAGSYVSNEINAAFTYAVSPRTTLIVTPAYRYARLTNDQQVNYLQNGQDFSAVVSLTRAMTPRQNLGVLYTSELLQARNNELNTTADTYFNTVEGYYGYQVAKTYWVRGQVGGEFTKYTDGQPGFHTIAGGVSLVKTFTKAEFAITYGRARLQENFVTARVGDRADVALTMYPFRRLILNAGAGSYREVGAEPRTKGSYAAGVVTFMLTPKAFSLFGNYSYIYQNSTTPQLLSGRRNLYSAGIKWAPGPAPIP